MMTIPDDLLDMLVDIRSDDEINEYWYIRFFKAVFRFNTHFDLIVCFNCYDQDGPNQVAEILECASYTAHILKQILARKGTLFPFIRQETHDFAACIGQAEYCDGHQRSDLEREAKIHEVRKALSPERRGWHIEPTDDDIRVHPDGELQDDFTRFFIGIPYSAPQRQYLNILKNLDLWRELIHSWDHIDAAIGLIASNQR